ncbi:MAG TPA: VCBS repeat-containing protein [Planctomycetota bacterium]|jgi:hypothetical protein
MRKIFVLFVFLGVCAFSAEEKAVPTEGGVKFVLHKIGDFRSEACGVGDFNGDGKLDIVAGPNLYLAPDFKPQKIRTLKGAVDDKGKGYYHDFANLPFDVDGDGKLDVVSVDWFSMSSTWFKNSLGQDGEWPMALVHKNGNFECGDLCDIDGKGKINALLPHIQPTVWYERGVGTDGKTGLVTFTVSEKKMEYGGGVGDINGDGRPDIVRPNAWFEAPADIRKDKWIEHPLSLGAKDGKIAHTAQILVYDVNGDGKNDIIASNAHGYGIFWYEQIREGDNISFKQHVIDDTWTQAHSLALGDLDGCGLPELVTGKRFMAHNGGDPDENGPLCVYYYKLKRNADKSVSWTRHVVSEKENIGSGMNVWLVDFDGDGDLDVVTTGKFGGPVWFENKTK